MQLLRNLIVFLINFTLIMSICLVEAQAYTGVYQGQGRGCWGRLYIRDKTIEWNTIFSVCKKAPYIVIEQDLTSKTPHIAFLLAQKSKTCRYQIIELSFDPQYPDYWLAKGYSSRQDFGKRFSKDEAIFLRTLICAVQKL